MNTKSTDDEMYDEITIGNPFLVQTIELLDYLDDLKNLKNNDSLEMPVLELKSNKLSQSIGKYTNESIDELIKKSLILILRHAGYHKVDTDCFDLLVDLLKSYLKNLTSLFRKKLDQEIILNPSTSTKQLDLLNKVFNELGLSFATFQQFNFGLLLYRDHVLNQIDDLKIELNLPHQ